ncbi:MAG: hypothetical protein ACI9D5_000442 [Candidatus Endobugula sp.]|jgi:hypothetical protein
MLDGSQVYATFDQVGTVVMAWIVGCDGFMNTAGFNDNLEEFLQSTSIHYEGRSLSINGGFTRRKEQCGVAMSHPI